MKLKHILLATITLTLGNAIYSAELVNEDFTGVTPALIPAAGIDFNEVNYKGYQAATGAHIGQGLGDGSVVTEVVDDAGDLTIRTFPTATQDPSVSWDENGEAVNPLSYLEIALPIDSQLTSINYNVRKSATSYWWTGLRYTTNGGETWSELNKMQITSTHFNDVNNAWTGNMSDVDAIRIYVWANGDSNPGYIFIDDIVVVGAEPQTIDSVSSDEPFTTVAFKGTGKKQPVYNFNIAATNLGNAFTLKNLDILDDASTDVATDVTVFKLYSTGASNSFNASTAVEIATDTAITPANLGSTFAVTTPPEMSGGDNYFWLVADIAAGATVDNTIKIKVPSITLNNGVDSVQTVTNADNTGSIIIKDAGANNSLVLDGTNYIDFTGGNGPLDWYYSFSFECLFNATDLSVQRTIMGSNSNSTYYGLKLAVNSDGSLFYGFKASSHGEATPQNRNQTTQAGIIDENEWYHVAVTYDGEANTPFKDNDVILYVNGVEVDRIVVADVPDGTVSGKVWDKEFRYIGHDYYGSNFVGRIDEVRLWNVARTQTQINDNKAATLNGDEAGLKFYVDMNDFTVNRGYGVGYGIGVTPDYSHDGAIVGVTDTEALVGATDDIGSLVPVIAKASDDSYMANPKAVLSKNVMDNDFVINGSSAYAHLVGSVSGLTLNTDGTFTFDPTQNADDPVIFTYELTDSATAGGTQYDTAQVTINKGKLTHHWAFEDDLNDSAGSATGTIFDGTEAYIAGKEGKALNLYGVDGYVAATPVTLGTGNASFSISTWINITEVPNENDRLFTYGDDLFGLHVDTDLKISLDIGGENIQTATNLITLGKWHHIVLTKDADTITIYVDGIAEATNTKSVNWAADQTLYIGARGHDPNNKTQFVDGAMDEIKAFSYALTADDINKAYTPAIGLEVVQTGTELTWSVAAEVGVREYQVVDVATGEVLEVVVAGKEIYSVTLPEGVTAKLVVVDNSGYTQTFVPADGNEICVVYDLTAGWNLIAMPGENADITDLKDVTIGNFWIWNGTAYEKTTAPQACEGVWVYAPRTAQTVVTANKSDAEITLLPGWNLVGPKENIEVPEAAHTVFAWNKTYEQILEGGTMLQGVGYWVFSL